MPLWLILLIVAGVLIVIVIVGASLADRYSSNLIGSTAIAAAVFAFAALIGAAAAGDEYERQQNENYERHSTQMCSEKGGVVNKDKLCMVKGQPVPFTDDVWIRNGE